MPPEIPQIPEVIDGNNRIPNSVVNGSISGNAIVMNSSYQTGNIGDLFFGKRGEGSPLPFNGKIKALYIIPAFEADVEHKSRITEINNKYSIY